MNNSINQELQNELMKICSNLARAQRLDKDAEKELYTHLEDKALDYMNGNEQLSQADILLLVREHFGDPEYLKNAFGELPVRKTTHFWNDFVEWGASGKGRDDFWGMMLYPWKTANRVNNAILYFLFPIVLCLIGFLTTGFYSVKGFSLSIVLGLLLGAGFGIETYLVYLGMGIMMERRRKTIRQTADLQGDCILANGGLWTPGFVQFISPNLVLTPMVGESVTVPMADIQKVTEHRSLMVRKRIVIGPRSTLFMGNNSFFKLEVKDRDIPLGFVVRAPADWRTVFTRVLSTEKKNVF